MEPDQTLFNSFFASDYFCHLLITLAISLDPGHVSPDLDPNCLFPEYIFKNINFEKISRRQQKSVQNYPAYKELT